MLILPSEATIRLSRDASRNIIQGKKHVPLGLMSLLDKARANGLFQSFIAFPSPEGIC